MCTNQNHKTIHYTQNRMTTNPVAIKLWRDIRPEYNAVRKLIPKYALCEFYTTRIAGSGASSSLYGMIRDTFVTGRTDSGDSDASIEPKVMRIISCLYGQPSDIFSRSELNDFNLTGELNDSVLESLLAFHNPIITTYIRDGLMPNIKTRMRIGRMLDQTKKILEVCSLSYLI